MKGLSILDHILYFWNYPISIGLPAVKISGGTVEIFCQSHTKVSLCTLSHYVPTDPTQYPWFQSLVYITTYQTTGGYVGA
jgi:hypothetical protein